MCGRNEDLQKLWKPKNNDWILIKKSREIQILYKVGEYPNKIIKDNTVYLPTQEQLQEMILNNGHQGYDNSGIATMLSYFSMEYKLEDLTFNELWLCYVMHEKYHKIWTGEKWEAIK